MTPEDHAVLLDLDASLDGRALDVIAPCGWLGDQGPVSLTPEQCAARYERVVVGSGSARVVPWVDALTTAGMSVTVVHRPGLVAPMLAAAADALVPLPRIGPR